MVKVTDIDLHAAEVENVRLRGIIEEQADEIHRLLDRVQRVEATIVLLRRWMPPAGASGPWAPVTEG